MSTSLGKIDRRFKMLPVLLAVLAAVDAAGTTTPVTVSTDKVLGIGVGTFIVAVATVIALFVCIGARGSSDWKCVCFPPFIPSVC